MARAKPVERPKFSTNAKPSCFSKNLPYTSKKKLLTEGELRFYRQGLKPAIGKKYLICPKVRLTDVLHVPPKFWKSAAGRKIQARHVDFVLASKSDFAIKAVIELDDASHLEKAQQVKDAYLDDALRAAGIVLLRFPIYKRYNAKLIGRIITDTLKRHRKK